MHKNYRIKLSSPDFNLKDREISSGFFSPTIENVELFEKSLANCIGTNYALALNSGTSALHLSLMLLGVEAGDEVICPDFTFAATVNAILYQKATPIFVDSESETWNLNPELLEYAIQERIKKGIKPKVVIVVHSFGMPAKIESISAICSRYQIYLVEDAAGALGSKYKNRMLGSWGDIGIFSFNNNKIITTGGGGAIVTNNEKWFIKGKYLANQAKSSTPYYEHLQVGYNYTINILGAELGLNQLKLLEKRISKRRDAFFYYKQKLNRIKSLTFSEETEFAFCNRWLTTVLTGKKVDLKLLKRKFEEKDIEVRFLWKPMHTQPAFFSYPSYLEGVSEELFLKGICLPSGNELSLGNQDEIIAVLFDFFN